MILFLCFVILLTLLFSAATYSVAVSKMGLWERSVSLVFTGGLSLLGFAILAVAGWGIWDHYRDLPEEVILAQMQQCADRRDRPAVLAELKRLGYEYYTKDEPYPGHYERLPADSSARSASYAETSYSHVRRPLFAGKEMQMVFLFDTQQHLITWSYKVNVFSL